MSQSKPVKKVNVQTEDVFSDMSPQYADAIKGPEGHLWAASRDKEYQSCIDNNTWTVVDRHQLPVNTNVISVKLVLKKKTDEAGNVKEYKTRLTPRGFEQQEGVDYQEVFAPTGRYRSMRLQLGIAAAHDLSLLQFDVPSAFLNARLDEEVYIEVPPGLDVGQNKVLKLNKALYGLKQAPREWYKLMSSFLRDACGFTPTVSDPCLFYKYSETGKLMLVFVFVDDLQAAVHKTDFKEFDRYVKHCMTSLRSRV